MTEKSSIRKFFVEQTKYTGVVKDNRKVLYPTLKSLIIDTVRQPSMASN